MSAAVVSLDARRLGRGGPRPLRGAALMIATEARMAELDAIAQRRALTTGESLELEALDKRLYFRRRKLPDAIASARARIESLLSELSPADRLRELRAEERRAFERRRALEDELEPGAHVARIEAELAGGGA